MGKLKSENLQQREEDDDDILDEFQSVAGSQLLFFPIAGLDI